MHGEYVLSRYLIASDIVSPAHHPDPSRLLFASRTGKSLLVKERIYRSLLAGEFDRIDQATLLQLRADEVLVPPTSDEFLDLLEKNQRGIRETHTLSLTLQPTANCQLGCGYCGQQHVKKNLDEDTSARIVARIMDTLRRKSYIRLAINWYGGEPILALKQIEDISGQLIEQCGPAGVHFFASMVTNGLSFKPDVYLRLQRQRVNSFQITLDGIGHIHDLMRPVKAGGGSFDIILQNLVDVTGMPEFSANRSGVTSHNPHQYQPPQPGQGCRSDRPAGRSGAGGAQCGAGFSPGGGLGRQPGRPRQPGGGGLRRAGNRLDGACDPAGF
ncbi:radical SAM protein [Chromobacterium piscinae]|uniref:radical SAM protein n=1 Tax=Chromobacterium piscinae TaxID=686831 RepID=UPI0032615E7B